ncbi:MAG: DUF418 domain-containing protein [Chitinophagaceae bacterium]|nr:DUF418 domain-containing protein [Chitinophagaceae bacterium]
MNPYQSSNRIITVDALRGFALPGILFAHFIFWYSGAGLPNEVYSKFSDPGSQIAGAFNGIFIFGKFFTFFSFLFGLSFYLQMQSLQHKEENFVLRYAWRLLILGVIGLMHHALWRGDILSIYVPLGFILLFARRLSNKWLLIIALLLSFNVPARIIELIHLFSNAKAPNFNAPPEGMEEAKRYYEIIKNGSFPALIKDNWKALISKFAFQFGSGRIYITLGFFMLGAYAGRMKWFETLDASKPVIKRICKISGFTTPGVIIIPIALFVINNAMKLGWENNRIMGMLFNFLLDSANTLMTIFYLSGVTMLMYKVRWQKILHPLAPVGKMALTMYLSQTIFGLILFYHIGFGLFEKTSPGINFLLTIPVFFIQILFCRWWLRRFNYGPVEWLWRSLTFGKWYPLKKQQFKAA